MCRRTLLDEEMDWACHYTQTQALAVFGAVLITDKTKELSKNLPWSSWTQSDPGKRAVWSDSSLEAVWPTLVPETKIWMDVNALTAQIWAANAGIRAMGSWRANVPILSHSELLVWQYFELAQLVQNAQCLHLSARNIQRLCASNKNACKCLHSPCVWNKLPRASTKESPIFPPRLSTTLVCWEGGVEVKVKVGSSHYQPTSNKFVQR